MSPTLQEFLRGLQECPQAMKMLGKELRTSRRDIEEVLRATVNPGLLRQPRRLFEQTPELIMQVLQGLDARDISHMDIALAAYDDREVFLKLIASRQFALSACNTSDEMAYVTWMSHRVIHFDALDLYFPQGLAYTSLLKSEQLTTLTYECGV